MNQATDFNMGERCYYATVGGEYKECDYYNFIYPCFQFFDYKTQQLKKVRFEDIHFKKIVTA